MAVASGLIGQCCHQNPALPSAAPTDFCPNQTMKLATYQDGSRDGQLVVVSRDLTQAHFANGIASRLQQVLDDWNFLSPQLQDLYVTLNQGKARHAFAFEPRQCMAPLPRAYQWACGSATLHPQNRQGQGAGQAQAVSATLAPWISQRASDDLLGPCQEAWFGAESWDIDFGAGLAVITGDVAMGASATQALDNVRLLMLVNDWTLRHFQRDAQTAAAADDLAPYPSPLHSQPASAFSPVAVTPDELGPAWAGGRVQLMLQSTWNGKRVGATECGPEMPCHFGELIAHLATTRHLRAGCIVGSGTISSSDATRGYHCIADKRAQESASSGQAATRYLQSGDSVRIEMNGRDGLSLFGAIVQRVAGPENLAEAEAAAAAAAAEGEDAGAAAPPAD